MDETVIGRTFWLVDPIDGTKEFLRRSGEFTVNIALIEDGEPVMGVVTAPAIGRAFRDETEFQGTASRSVALDFQVLYQRFEFFLVAV